MTKNIDVIVVGAGPVGLLAAIELRLQGVGVLVLERLAAPSTVSKALSIGPLGIEALQRRGMGTALAAVESAALAMMKRPALSAGGPRLIGHFGGLFLLRADAQDAPDRHMRPVNQQAAEAMLAERAQALGIEVRRECEVTGIGETADGLAVDCATPAGVERLHCAWLVACDGGRSTVRKLAGFAFPGTPPTMTMYQASVELDHPERLQAQGWRRTEGGVFSYGLLPGRLFMLDFSGAPPDRDAPVTHAELEAVLRRVACADVRVRAFDSASRWTDNTRLADTYRRGRILLAGDAAHIHAPFGGQGMSLGLVDAANLGWKLAAVVQGAMPDSLLDTYTAERRPAAEAVLANTLAQSAIMRPDPNAGAMRDLMARLLGLDDVNRLVGRMMTGLSTRYDVGAEPDAAGRLLADRATGTGATLYGLMQDGHGVLLDASAGRQASRRVATDRVRCVAVAAGPSMLVRPDACLAWVGEDGGIAGLEDALRRWFGPCAVSA